MLNNKPLSAIIIDDELNAIRNLQNLIRSYCKAIDVIDIAQSADAGAYLANTSKPDVLFLDISMPTKNGFDLINMLTYTPAIVFVTAHEQYAINAIKASAVDFLLKPVDITELRKVEIKLLAIKTVWQQHDIQEGYKATINNLVGMLQNSGVIKTITLPEAHSYSIINTSDILYLIGENNYTYFYLVRGQKVIVSHTLKEYELMLSESGFLRIHKSYIINLDHLRSIESNSRVSVLMNDGKELDVSRRRAPELLKIASQHVAR